MRLPPRSFGHIIEVFRVDANGDRITGPGDLHRHETTDPVEARCAFAALRAEIEARNLPYHLHDTSLFSRREADRIKHALRRAGFRGIGRGGSWGFVLRHPRHPDRAFRILLHLDRMDICDGALDRWANSLGASVPVPLTPDQARAALADLIADSAAAVRTASASLTKGLPTITVAHRLSHFLRPGGYALVLTPVNHGSQVRVKHYSDEDPDYPEISWSCTAREWRSLAPWLTRIEPCQPRPRRGGWWVFALTAEATTAIEEHERLYHHPTAHDRMVLAARAHHAA